MLIKVLELKHTIKLIREFSNEIDEIGTELKFTIDKLYSSITTTPAISFRMGAIIIDEIRDFNNFG